AFACVSGVIWGAAACSSSSGDGSPSPDDAGPDAMETSEASSGSTDATTMMMNSEAGPDAGTDSTVETTDGGADAGDSSAEVVDSGITLDAASYDASNSQFD